MLVIMRKLLSYKSLTKLKSHNFYADPQASFSLLFDRKVCIVHTPYIGCARMLACLPLHPAFVVLSPQFSFIFLKRQVLFLACGVNATLQMFLPAKSRSVTCRIGLFTMHPDWGEM